MNSEEDEFRRIEREALRRAAQADDDDDDTQDYVRGRHYTAEQMLAWGKATAEAEREACAKLCDDLDDDIVDGLAGWQYAEAIRARGTT